MHSFAAAGAGFLLAVSWFDLMFDVQTRRHKADSLPQEVPGLQSMARQGAPPTGETDGE